MATRVVIASLLGQLVQTEPGGKQAEQVRAELEHALMRVLVRTGPQGLAAFERRLRAQGVTFTRTTERGSLRAWRADLPQERLLEIAVNAGPYVRTVYVDYRSTRARRLTKREREAAARQAVFYTRYLAAGRIAYTTGGRGRLKAADRLILVVGELEADVNNGGFRQYLENKGIGRAREAVEALERIGARRTLRMLKAAMTVSHGPRLDSLDEQFQKAAEDLPGLTMKSLEHR
jgi:hypothetical protein